MQGELTDFWALGDPRTLQVFDVIEEDAGECLHAEVLGGSDGFGFEDGVLRLERPTDEGGEASGAVLQIPQSLQVLKSFLNGLDVTEHHRCAGVEPDLVGAFHDLEPFVGVALERRDSGAHSVDKDFSTSSGDGTESGCLELAEHIRYGHSENLGEVLELGRRESVHVDVWKAGANVAQHF